MRLFAERLLVDPIETEVPEADHYDEERAISVTADGRPFVEAPSAPSLVTLTEAEGEGVDQGSQRLGSVPPTDSASASSAPWATTNTRADGEAPERPIVEDDRLHLWATTMTKATAEAPDAPVMVEGQPAPDLGESASPWSSRWATTETAAPGEAPDAPPMVEGQTARGFDEPAWPRLSLWAITKTAAPGEAPDR
jgi:hypothetical protein